MTIFTPPWWLWAIAAVAVALAELHVPGSYLIWIGLGLGVTAAASAAWTLSLAAQIVIFAVAALASCGLGYFVYRRLNHPTDAGLPLNQRDRLMIGATGVVCEPFHNGRGKVRLGDTVWLAEGPDMTEGTAVVIKSVRGTALIVDAA